MPRTRTGSFRYGDPLGWPVAIGASWVPGLTRQRRTAQRALLPGGRRHAGAHRRTKDGASPAGPTSPAPHA
jgi:hypothetical protein